MLKKLGILTLIIALTMLFSSCGECEHQWDEATCSQAKHCTLCYITEGEPLGHSWTEATYEAPKTCSGCGIVSGEPLERPKFSEDEILASNAIVQNQYRFDFLFGSDKKLEYDEENGILLFVLTPYSGAADAYSQRGDNWGLYTTYIEMINSEISFALKSEGFDVPFKITVLDDRDPSKALFEIQNQSVLTDVYADIVPQALKTIAFEKAFYNTYHNYGDKYEITVEYNKESEILYFYVKLDEMTSFVFNSLPASEVVNNVMWKSLTEAVTRWSGDYTTEFINEGYEVLCVYMLLDGTTSEDAYYAAAGGEEFYNCFG